jgi:uncharacterized Zn-finger protein
MMRAMEAQNRNSHPSITRTRYEVSRKDLPIRCPMPGSALRDAHPRVYLPLGELGHARCYYCGAEYVFKL